MIRHPAQAARLREPILEQVPADPGQIVLTSNVGCAMHIAAGTTAAGLDIEVLHPVELLARQLAVKTPSGG
jgi:glycolate oxidase iron-sulfur subunit